MANASAMTQPSMDTVIAIETMRQAALAFTAPEQVAELSRKLLQHHASHKRTERERRAMAAAAAVLAADLAIVQPSANGVTAIDRLARARVAAPEGERQAIAALQQARFRLLQLDSETGPEGVAVRDMLSGEMLRILHGELPPLPIGMIWFARLALLGEGVGCLAGTITPLDPGAFSLARTQAPRSEQGRLRWAESVYAHVVRHGGLEVAGLNQPQQSCGEGDGAAHELRAGLAGVAMAWAGLGAAAPNAELLQKTRAMIDLPTLLHILACAITARHSGKPELTAGLECMLRVQIETLAQRERAGFATLRLDTVAAAVEAAIRSGEHTPGSRVLFAELRRRVGGSVESHTDNPALDRLMQRIQALRAKTVDHGCTEPEALSAAEKVAELLDRHGLSLSALDFQTQPCASVGVQTNRRRITAIDTCVPAIAAFFDCRVWVERSKGAELRYVFFGLRGDVTAAEYLYERVEQAFATETARFRNGRLYFDMAGERRLATTSFQTGLAQGIAAKLEDMRLARNATQRSASGRDLVPVKAALVKAAFEKLGLNLHPRVVGGSRSVLTDAFAAGQTAGRAFNHNRAIG